MTYLLVMLAVSLALSSVGWKYFVYFFSVGYGFGIAALAVTVALLFAGALSLPTFLICLLLVVYGCRLGGYLLLRERRSPAYRKILYGPGSQDRRPVGVMLMIWVFCALLYVGQVSPVAFRLANTRAGAPVQDAWAWAGLALMVAGFLLEAGADAQKSAAKKRDPKTFVSTGLYRLVRCPNYLGELVLWTGSLLVAVGACCTFWQWVIVLLGYLGIVYVMFSGARRLELRQDATYGADPRYQEYVKKTPILLPFIPLYSVSKYGWLRA